MCNPNNPTASITPKNELREFIATTPQQTMILVDEAYFHYADSPDYESVIPLDQRSSEPDRLAHVLKDLRHGWIALRLLSSHNAETIERMRPHQMWDSVNIMALAAAIASLERRRIRSQMASV